MKEQYSSYFLRFKRLFKIIAWLIHLAYVCKFSYPKMQPKEQETYTYKKARKLLNILNINLQIRGEVPLKLNHSLIVANHISWLDMVALLSLYPINFVAKKEIKKWPIIGNIVSAIGSVFIDRTRRKDTEYINQTVAQGLQEGKNVMFFPEAGTSADGYHLKPFKSSLFYAAILAGSPVQAIALRYYEQNQRTNRSAYSQDMNLIRCVWNIVSLPEHEVRLDFLPLIDSNMVSSMTRHQIKELIEKEIKEIVYQDFQCTIEKDTNK